MIIYSMTRKETSFGQLVHYILEREAPDNKESFTYLHGFDPRYVNTENPQTIIEGFRRNAKPIYHMDNRIKMYHEIMSFSPEDSHLITLDTLLDISRKYADVRGRDGLVMARPHFDKNHIHVHFMISGNKVGTAKSMRVSKKEFEKQKLELQGYQLKHYPELIKSYVRQRHQEEYVKPKYNNTTQTQKRKQMEKHNRAFTIKENLKNMLEKFIPQSNSLYDLVRFCKKNKYTVYERSGIPQGVIYNGKKHRFTTLLKKSIYKEKVELMKANAQEWHKAELKAQELIQKAKPKLKQKYKRKYKP